MLRSLALALPFRASVARCLPPKKLAADPLSSSATAPAAKKEAKKRSKKRALSGYDLYRRAQRGQLAGVSGAEIQKALATGWADLPPEQQAEYNTRAADAEGLADEDRRTLERIVRSMPDKPPRNALFLLAKERRPTPSADELEGLSGFAVVHAYNRAARDAWAALSEDEKQDFTNRLVRAKIEYNKALRDVRRSLPPREICLAEKNGLSLTPLRFKGSSADEGKRQTPAWNLFVAAFFKEHPLPEGMSQKERRAAFAERKRLAAVEWQARKLFLREGSPPVDTKPAGEGPAA